MKKKFFKIHRPPGLLEVRVYTVADWQSVERNPTLSKHYEKIKCSQTTPFKVLLTSKKTKI